MDSVRELLMEVFGWVCGQNWEHTWAPGGEGLVCCQRCTGLYAGAALGLLLRLLARPQPTARFFEFHGVLLLLMVPFGLHWVPQGPVLRTGSGFLFGAGVVAYLSLMWPRTSGWWGRTTRWGMWLYVAGLVAGLGLTLGLAGSASRAGWLVLTVLVATGAGVLLGLVAVGVWRGLLGLSAGCLRAGRCQSSRAESG